MSKKPLEEPSRGIHRAKLWEIMFYAMNNTSTNIYLNLVGSISYFLVGIVGVGAVLAGSIITIMRVWDGVTDPFVGMLVDNTNTKFGKNRPFIVIGQAILFGTTLIMFNVIPRIPSAGRFIVFIVLYCVYIIGYTFQCVVTKSAQTCMTNDPEQRPIFAMFDSLLNVMVVNVFIGIYRTNTLVPKYTLTSAANGAELDALLAKIPELAKVVTVKDGVTTLSGFYNPGFWHEGQLVLAAVAAVFAICAIIGISRKDNAKYYGLGKVERITFRDYTDVLAHNRGIQMLIVAASSDKLAAMCKSNVTVVTALYGIVFGQYALFSSNSAITSIPAVIISMCGVGFIARKLGQKRCLVVGTIGALVMSAITTIMIIVGKPGMMALPVFSLTKVSTWAGLFNPASWSLFGVLWIVVFVLCQGFNSMAGNIVIPMTADCADYEVYRSKRYVPGLMGTLFSFVDKLISSLGTTVVALTYAVVGFKDTLPTPETPYSTGIMVATIFCFVGMPVIGWMLNIVAMKFYPLSKERMAEIQDEITRIKMEAARS